MQQCLELNVSFDDIRLSALNGWTYTALTLHSNTINELIQKGFEIKKFPKLGVWSGQYYCLVVWENIVIPGSLAEQMLHISMNASKQAI